MDTNTNHTIVVPPEASDAAPPAADTIAGRYRILRQVGVGGMAEVLLARDEHTGERVAIKRLRHVAPRLAARLRTEAAAMAAIDHPHVLRVRQVGEEGGAPFVVLDFVARGSVQDRARRAGPVPVGVMATWAVQILFALDHVHRCGIVHRDIKPANLLIAADGGALLCDFGIALVPGAVATPPRSILGSPSYMPPEQALDPDSVDGRADLYALGATIGALVAGEPSSPDDEAEGVPPELRPIVLRAVRADREERYADAREMALALAPYVPPEVWARQPALAAWVFPPPVRSTVARPGVAA